MRDEFFTQDGEDKTKCTCICGKTRNVKGTFYSNFVAHVQTAHPKEYTDLVQTNAMKEFSSSSKTSEMRTSLFFLQKRFNCMGC